MSCFFFRFACGIKIYKDFLRAYIGSVEIPVEANELQQKCNITFRWCFSSFKYLQVLVN